MTEKRGLLERLDEGPVICAEGYLFEFERRGYLQAGAFVPEVVLEHPELVAQLHREFVHAGSDVVEAFTYYGHREKLRDHRQGGPARAAQPPRRCEIAREVARRDRRRSPPATSRNTNVFAPDAESRAPRCARCSRSRSAGRSRPASTSSSARRSRGARRR